MRGFPLACITGALALASAITPGLAAAQSGAVEASPAPQDRPASSLVTSTRNIPPNLGFPAWKAGFRNRALAAGIDAEIFDAAMKTATFNANVVKLDSRQAEFSRQIWEYLDTAVSDQRIAGGRKALADHAEILTAIEARYGVEQEVVAAIWGLETAYGTFAGDVPVLGAMATLAYDGRRTAFFEEQLIAALRIVQAGDVDAEHMIGSWAGAMGHTQFMPGSFLQYAVDFTGDGKRDIWGDDPADALASTAAYLHRHGWTMGQPWGVEVTLPEDFDYALAGARIRKTAAEWNAMGVRDRRGSEIADHGPASILLPAGHRGVAIAIFANFHVLERYNAADAYVIAVGHLSDRIAGADAFRAPWPRGDRALSRAEKEDLQRRLLRAGFDPKGVDGIIGPASIAAIRAFQAAEGLVPDGYASAELLSHLR